MKRSTFLKKSLLASLGLAFGASFLSACRKEELLPDSDFSGKVVIIGAGAAGLYAAYILKSRGIEVAILEAGKQAGGRLGKRTDFADYPIDLGAQWLHGRNSILGDLIDETGTKVKLDESNAAFWFNNQIMTTLPKDLESLVAPNEDASDISFWEYAQQQGLGNEYRYLVEQLAGDFGADASEISIKWTAVEEEDWNSGDDDFKFEATFFDLIDQHITEKVRDSIVLNTIVSKIDYGNDIIQITDSMGNDHLADKVIVTVPITVLQDGDIDFVPPLPAAKVDAFNKIGMGAGMKVFMKFSSKFYDGNIGGGEICAAYADESEGKVGSDHVLLAFVMGKQAEYLTSLGSDAAITSALLGELDNMYGGQASAAFIDAHVENWTTNPFVRGAYSFSKIGIGNARHTAAEAVEGKLFFAGEAMNTNGHHQTVHGAIETGYREVINLLKS